MKLIIDKDKYWIKDDTVLTSNFDSMRDYDKWRYIYDNNLLHKIGGPAIIKSNGTKYWYLNGLLHREDGPAVIWFYGYQAWYLNDRPAVIKYNGYKTWYLNNIQVEENIYNRIENSSKEELLMYLVLPKYKNYLPLIDYRLNII